MVISEVVYSGCAQGEIVVYSSDKIVRITPHELPGLMYARFSYNPTLIEHIKNVVGERYPGSFWDAPRKAWVVSKDHLPAIMAKAERMGCTVNLTEETYSGIDFHPLPEFTEYQKRAIKKLSTQRALLLQWEMGIGKTALAICAADQIPGICLVVAPQNVLFQWEEQIARWSSNKNLESIHRIGINKDEVPDDLARIKFVLVSYGMIHKLPPTINPTLIVYDELHYLIHKASNRSKLCKDVSLKFPHAYRLGLTATPISSQLYNVHQQLDILCPHRYGTYYQWVTFYHKTDCNGYEGALQIHGLREDHFDDLIQRLSQICDIATKSDASGNLPDVNWAQQSLGEASISSTAFTLQNWKKEQQKLALERATKVAEFATVQQKQLEAEYPDEQSRPKTIFITYLRRTAYALGDLLGCDVVTGELPSKKRLSILSKSKLVVATLRSINEGIELPQFTRIYVVESFPVPLYMTQVLARFIRFGQKVTVFVTFLAFCNTSDEIIPMKLLSRLQEQSKIVPENVLQRDLRNLLTGVGDDDTFLKELCSSLQATGRSTIDDSDWDFEYDDSDEDTIIRD